MHGIGKNEGGGPISRWKI